MRRLSTLAAAFLIALAGTFAHAPAGSATPDPLRVEESASTQDVVKARERLKAAEKAGDHTQIKAARKELREAKKKRDDLRAKLKARGSKP